MENNLEEKIQSLLEEWNTVAACQEIKKPEHEEWIRENAWEKLVPLINPQLTQENWDRCPQILVGCQELLCYIASIGNPKEVLISLIDDCEAFQDDHKYRHILPAIAVLFQKWGVNGTSTHNLEWCLATLVSHVHALGIPDVPVLEGKERLTLDADRGVVELCQTLEAFTDLLQHLVTAWKNAKDDLDPKVKKNWAGHLSVACIQVLAKPLAYLHLDSGSTSRQIGEDLIGIIRSLVSNPVNLFSYGSALKHFDLKASKLKDSDDFGFDIRWSRGIGILFYLTFDQIEFRPFVPSCYAPLHLFNSLLGNMNLMMIDDQNYLLHLKSIGLAKHLLSGIDKETLQGDLFDLGIHTEFVKSLFKAIIYHGSSDVRKVAFANFQHYMSLFTARGRYRLIQMVLTRSNHSGLIGFTITQLKNTIVEGLNKGFLEDVYQGKSLQSLVRNICQLKHKEETDLLEVSDEVMSSLNFLICILLRDTNNKTGIRDFIDDLEENYLVQIEKGISLLRSHYKIRLRDLSDPSKADQDPIDEMTLTIGGRVVPVLDAGQLADVFGSALSAFDMMECVLIQLKEALKKVKCETQNEKP